MWQRCAAEALRVAGSREPSCCECSTRHETSRARIRPTSERVLQRCCADPREGRSVREQWAIEDLSVTPEPRLPHEREMWTHLIPLDAEERAEVRAHAVRVRESVGSEHVFGDP